MLIKTSYKNWYKERFKKTQRTTAYIYSLIKTPYKNWYEERFEGWEKLWKEIRACRENFEVKSKGENTLRVNKWVSWDIYDY